MDFRFSPEESAFRDEVREFILAEIPPEIRWQDRTAYSDDLWPSVLEARRKVARRGWTTMHWPAEHGGQDCSPVTHMLFREEMAYQGVPEAVSYDDGPNLIGPAIIEFGSDHLKSAHLPAIAAAETFWCQGYTEPGGELTWRPSGPPPSRTATTTWSTARRTTWAEGPGRTGYTFWPAPTRRPPGTGT